MAYFSFERVIRGVSSTRTSSVNHKPPPLHTTLINQTATRSSWSQVVFLPVKFILLRKSLFLTSISFVLERLRKIIFEIEGWGQERKKKRKRNGERKTTELSLSISWGSSFLTNFITSRTLLKGDLVFRFLYCCVARRPILHLNPLLSHSSLTRRRQRDTYDWKSSGIEKNRFTFERGKVVFIQIDVLVERLWKWQRISRIRNCHLTGLEIGFVYRSPWIFSSKSYSLVYEIVILSKHMNFSV